MAGFRTFATGEVLTAANVNDFLMKQSVMVFADDAARTAALGAEVVEGMLTYNEDTEQLEVYDGSAFVLAAPAPPAGIGSNVVSVTKSNPFSTSSLSLVDITGLAATITLTSDTSKVMALLTFGQVDAGDSQNVVGDVTRNGTPIGIGDAAGSRLRTSWAIRTAAANRPQSVAWSFVDSPATTSALTYQARLKVDGDTALINQSDDDTDAATRSRAICTLTLIEVAA